MAAYLGKISAVITANTTDFTRRVGAARGELEAFARSTRNSVSRYKVNLDDSALNKTLTKLQLFRRTLAEAGRLQIDTGPLRDLYQLVNDLANPLAKVKNEIESLGNNAQAQLYPALERVQRGFQRMYTAIEQGRTTLPQQTARVAELTRQIQLLGNSTAVIKDISSLGKSLETRATGATFIQPRAQEELKRAKRLREEASSLPAAQRQDPFWMQQADLAERSADAIQRSAARIERYRNLVARMQPGPRRDAAISAQVNAEAQHDRQVERLAARNRMMEMGLSAGRMQATTASIGRQALPADDTQALDRARSKIESVANALRAAKPSGAFEPYITNLRAMADAAAVALKDLQPITTELMRLNAQLATSERLAASQNAVTDIVKNAAARGDSLSTRQQQINKTLRDASVAGVSPAEIQAARRKDVVASTLAPQAARMGARVADLTREFQSGLRPQLNAVNAEIRRLTETSMSPTADEIKRLATRVRELGVALRAAERSSEQLSRFDAATAMNTLPRSIQDFTHDFQLFLNLAGQLDDNTGTQFAGRLQQMRERARQIAVEIAQIQQAPPTTASTARRSTLLDEVRQMSPQLAREMAQMDPTRFTERQINRMLSSNRRLRGDFAGMRGGAQAAQMGIQQLAFAVDDFFSATGGAEQKIRAISNNLTQFGFVLGGTYGLIASVSAVVGTQLILQFTGIGKASKEAEHGLKFMNENLEKSKNLTEENIKAFKELAKSIKDAGASGLMSGRNNIQNTIEERRQKQKEEREARFGGVGGPALRTAAGERRRLEEELEKTTNPSDRYGLEVKLRAAREKEKAAKESSMREPSMGQVGTLLRESGNLPSRFSYEDGVEAWLRTFGNNNRIGSDFGDPANRKDAIGQIDKQLEKLYAANQKDNTLVWDWANRFLARNLPESMYSGENANAIRDRDKMIDKLREAKAALEAAASEMASEALNKLAEDAIAAGEAAKEAFSTLAQAGVDTDIRGKFESQIGKETEAIQAAIDAMIKAESENKSTEEFEEKIREATESLKRLLVSSDDLAQSIALGATITTAQRLASAGETLQQISSPTVAGTNLARAQAAMERTQRERDRAADSGDTEGVKNADKELERLRKFGVEINAAALAVTAFQRAAIEAAGALTKTLVEEARASADQLRRRRNRYADDDTMGPQARSDYEDAVGRREAADDFGRRMEAEINRERTQFENEMDTGRNPAAAELAEKERAGIDTQNNNELSATERESGRIQAEQARADLERMFRNRPGVAALGAEADARDSVEQARLEEARKKREVVERTAAAASSLAGSGLSAALEVGSRGGLASEIEAIDRDIKDLRDKISDTAAAGVEVGPELEAAMQKLLEQAFSTREEAFDSLIGMRKGAGYGYQAQSGFAKRELEQSGVMAAGFQGDMVEADIRRQMLTEEQRIFAEQGNTAAVDRVQSEIDDLDQLGDEFNAAAIAVAGFQRAAAKAALELQGQVSGESRSAADSARRELNKAEVVFGPNSPQAAAARRDMVRTEQAAAAAEKEKLMADAEVAGLRADFEDEMKNGGRPEAQAAADRAKRIAEEEQVAADMKNSPAGREAAAARARLLRLEQEADFQNLPEVQAARKRADDADKTLKEAESAARGRELMKTERERAIEDIMAKAGDLGNEKKKMHAEGRGAGANDQVKQGAFQMARDAAPLWAQLGEEMENAKLNGPSRAALNASDIQTSEGAKELNRLLRGDDPNRNVNLAEMKKQSALLDAIERAILAQTNVVVEL